MQNKRTKLAASAAVAAAAVAALTLTGTAADAGRLITGADIKNNSVSGKDIANGTVALKDLNAKARSAISAGGAQGEQGPAGPAGPKGEPGDAASDVLGGLAVAEAFDANVANIGGSFTARATQVGSFTLEPGTYVLTSDAFFISNAATSGLTRLQLAVRGEDGSQWGSDLGTCFTGAASTLKDREATCTTSRPVVIGEETTVNVKAFGYADDQGSADSGKFDVKVSVSAVKVG